MLPSLHLVHPHHLARQALKRAFADLPGVTVHAGLIEDLPRIDCIISAGNSFGLMDGGVDASIAEFFGPEAQRAVQERIRAEHLGELPVGACLLLETRRPTHPFLAYAPTMRVPMDIARTDNVYLALWAALCTIHRHNRNTDRPIQDVASPLLGAGAGHVPYAEASRQMALAYRHALHPPESLTWPVALARQESVRYGGDVGLHLPPEEEPEGDSDSTP